MIHIEYAWLKLRFKLIKSIIKFKRETENIASKWIYT